MERGSGSVPPPSPFKLLLARRGVLSAEHSKLEKEISGGDLRSLSAAFSLASGGGSTVGLLGGCCAASGSDAVRFHARLDKATSTQIPTACGQVCAPSRHGARTRAVAVRTRFAILCWMNLHLNHGVFWPLGESTCASLSAPGQGLRGEGAVQKKRVSIEISSQKRCCKPRGDGSDAGSTDGSAGSASRAALPQPPGERGAEPRWEGQKKTQKGKTGAEEGVCTAGRAVLLSSRRVPSSAGGVPVLFNKALFWG